MVSRLFISLPTSDSMPGERRSTLKILLAMSIILQFFALMFNIDVSLSNERQKYRCDISIRRHAMNLKILVNYIISPMAYILHVLAGSVVFGAHFMTEIVENHE